MGAVKVAYWEEVTALEERHLESILRRKQAYIDRIRGKPLDEITEAEYKSVQRTEEELKCYLAVLQNTKKLRDAYLHQSKAEADTLARLTAENYSLRAEVAKYKAAYQECQAMLEAQFDDQKFLINQNLRMLKHT